VTAALILQHGDWGPPGLLGEWAANRGLPFEIHRVDLGQPLPEPDGQPFIVSLGSKYSPRDTDVPVVSTELEFIQTAVARDVPVLGLCYGAQVLAHVLGATVEPAPEPELGWHTVRSSAPEIVPEGPWLQWHYERFSLPPGARELARSDRGVQAFSHGRHLGVQFHPESTVDIVAQWARLDAERLASQGIGDGQALLAGGEDYAEPARRAAFQLFDAFWARARRPERRHR